MAEPCRECRLYKSSQTSNGLYSCNKLMGVGGSNPLVMFVLDYLGDEEVKAKTPVVNLMGQMLKRAITTVGIDPENCYYTYLCKCKPDYDKPTTKTEITACLKHLDEEIQAIKPKLIVAVGGTVATALGVKGTITQIHGGLYPNEKYGCDILPIYHPAYVNNFVEQARQRKEWIQDLGKIIGKLTGKPKVDQPTNYRTAKTLDDVRSFVDELLKSEWISFDTETTGFDVFRDKLLLTSFSNAPGIGYVIPYQYPGVFTEEEQVEVKKELNRLMGSTTVKKIMQNGKFDLQFLFTAGIECKMFAFDTMLAHHLIDENSMHGLDKLTPVYTDMVSYKEGTTDYFQGKIKIPDGVDEKGVEKFRKCTIFDCPYDQFVKYSAQDADATFRLFNAFWPILEQEKLLPLLLKVVTPLSYVLARMEYTGIAGDTAYVEEMATKFEDEAKLIINNIQNSLPVKKYLEKYNVPTFNLNSPKQKSQLLYDIMELKPLKINRPTDKQRSEGKKQGNASTDVEALELLLKHNKIKLLEDIINYGRVKKFKEYMLEYRKLLASSPDGRIRTSFNQTTTKTGRLSSGNPNLQNIPKHDPVKAKLIRRSFVSREGYSLIEADYSQIEFKIWGHCSDDEILLSSLNAPGRDIHYRVAAQVYKIDVDKVTKDQRSMAKQVVYGMMYGRGSWSIAKEYGMTEAEVNRFINGFFSSFPKASTWMETNIATMEKQGYLTNLLGRRRRATDIFSKIKELKEAAKRQARNFPLQSGAADLMFVSMIKTYKALLPFGDDAKMLLQIHDSLIFEVKDTLVSTVVPAIKEAMETALKLKCYANVEVEIGKNLGEMIHYDPTLYNVTKQNNEVINGNAN